MNNTALGAKENLTIVTDFFDPVSVRMETEGGGSNVKA